MSESAPEDPHFRSTRLHSIFAVRISSVYHGIFGLTVTILVVVVIAGA